MWHVVRLVVLMRRRVRFLGGRGLGRGRGGVGQRREPVGVLVQRGLERRRRARRRRVLLLHRAAILLLECQQYVYILRFCKHFRNFIFWMSIIEQIISNVYYKHGRQFENINKKYSVRTWLTRSFEKMDFDNLNLNIPIIAANTDVLKTVTTYQTSSVLGLHKNVRLKCFPFFYWTICIKSAPIYRTCICWTAAATWSCEDRNCDPKAPDWAGCVNWSGKVGAGGVACWYCE